MQGYDAFGQKWVPVKEAEFTYYLGPHIVLACPSCTRLLHIGNVTDPKETDYIRTCQCGTIIRYTGIIEVKRK